MSAYSLDATIAALVIAARTVTVYSYATGEPVSVGTFTVKALNCKSITAIPQEVNARDCPLLFPNSQNWLGAGVSGWGGDNTGALQKHEYSLNYILAYAQDGEGREIKEFYAPMAALVQELTNKILRIDMTATKVTRVSVTAFGQITDPVGKGFIGCGLTVSATENIP